MADDDPKDRRWLAEMPQLERLLSAAELDTPPTSLEARLLQGLREAELLEAELHVMSSPEGPPPCLSRDLGSQSAQAAQAAAGRVEDRR